MKRIEEIGISPFPWEVEDTLSSFPIRTCDVAFRGYKVVKNVLENDARLIASAPELYEALSAIVNWYEQNKPLPYEENGVQMIMHYAKTALAKASGMDGCNCGDCERNDLGAEPCEGCKFGEDESEVKQ